MPNRNQEKTKGLIRHLLTLIGGILVTIGFISAEDSSIIVTALMEVFGGVLVLWGVIASMLNKEKLIEDGNA